MTFTMWFLTLGNLIAAILCWWAVCEARCETQKLREGVQKVLEGVEWCDGALRQTKRQQGALAPLGRCSWELIVAFCSPY